MIKSNCLKPSLLCRAKRPKVTHLANPARYGVYTDEYLECGDANEGVVTLKRYLQRQCCLTALTYAASGTH